MKRASEWSAAVLVICVSTATSYSTMITPSGVSDAVVNRDWGAGFPASVWVTHEMSPTLVAEYDPSDPSYRWWRVPELQFPLDGLAGMTDVQATLSLYVTQAGRGDMQLRFLGDGTGTVLPTDIFNSGSVLATFPSDVTGWRSFDVSADIQSAIDAGHDWAVFTVRPNDWWNSITIAASEDTVHSPMINVVPEPAPIFLVLIGMLLGEVTRTRHRKRGRNH